MEDAETIFIPYRRILLLTYQNVWFLPPDPPNINFFVPFQHLLCAGGHLPHGVLHILADITKRFDTTRIAMETMGQNDQNQRQLPAVIEHHHKQTDDRGAFARTTVIKALEEETPPIQNHR